MDCSKIIELIPQYRQGELDEETHLQIEQHLDACPKCKQESDREQSIRQLLNDGAVPDPPQKYWDGFNPKLIEEIKLVGVAAWKIIVVPAVIVAVLFPLSLALEEDVSPMFDGYLGKFIVLQLSYLPIIAAFAIWKSWLTRTILSFEQPAQPRVSKFRQFITATPRRCKLFEGAKRVLLVGILAFLIIYCYPIVMDLRVPRGVIYTLCGLEVALLVTAWLQTRLGDPRKLQSGKYGLWNKRVANAILAAAGLSFMWWQIVGTDVMNEPFEDSLKAISMSNHGNTKYAIALLERSIIKNQGKPKVLYCYDDLGESLSKTGQTHKARQVYQAGIRAFKQMLYHPAYIYVSSDRIDLFQRAASLYMKLGDRKEAFNAYQGMLQAKPHDYWNMVNVAEDYSVTGYHGQARALFERVIAEYPNRDTAVWAQLHLAQEYDKEGKRDQALTLYNRIISEHPDSYEAGFARQALNKLRQSPRNSQ